VTDQLPSFAKSYILPKVMKKDSVDARLRKTDPTTTTTTEVQNGVDVEVKDDNKSLEAFKFSMLKASLDYESGFVGTAKSKLIFRGTNYFKVKANALNYLRIAVSSSDSGNL